MTHQPPPTMHPVQTSQRREQAEVRSEVTLAAYEVYCALYGKQEAMVTGWCRGGFAASELIALLYARSFPREQWRARVDAALEGMKGLSP